MKLSLLEVRNHIPKHVDLCYIDQNDSFGDHPELLESVLKTGTLDGLYDHANENDWFMDAQCQAEDDYIDRLVDDLEEAYPDINRDEIADTVDDYRDSILETLHNLDVSNPVGDLLRNTSDQTLFYDTGHFVEQPMYLSAEEYEDEVAAIKKALGIPHVKYDKAIMGMMGNAGYGGNLVIYFYDSIDHWVAKPDEPAPTSITFKNPVVAIINTMNGSGGDNKLPGHEFTLAFDRAQLFLDKTFKYNYTFAVCSMYSDWCDCTEVKLGSEPAKEAGEAATSQLSAAREEDRRLAEVFKSGKCTFGDMDMNRHRHTYYDNNFPCGTRCKDCGTFWID